MLQDFDVETAGAVVAAAADDDDRRGGLVAADVAAADDDRRGGCLPSSNICLCCNNMVLHEKPRCIIIVFDSLNELFRFLSYVPSLPVSAQAWEGIPDFLCTVEGPSCTDTVFLK